MWQKCADQLAPENNIQMDDDVKQLQYILWEKIASLGDNVTKLSFGEEISPEMFATSLAELKKMVRPITENC